MDGYCTNAGQRDDDKDVAEILCSLLHLLHTNDATTIRLPKSF